VKSPAELTETFRANGLKVTPQRQLLFGLMHGNTVHPTAEALFAEASARMPGISLRTVYQTLTDLASMGELRLIDVGNRCHTIRSQHRRSSPRRLFVVRRGP